MIVAMLPQLGCCDKCSQGAGRTWPGVLPPCRPSRCAASAAGDRLPCMPRTGGSLAGAMLALAIVVAGCGSWLAFARARNLGQGADALAYAPAQYALAARWLQEHGRPATPFALPIELS